MGKNKKEKLLTEAVEETTSGTSGNQISKVILFNDNYHTYRQVIIQLQKAIGCSEDVAFSLTHNIDRLGQAEVFRGNIFDCVRVSSILKEINLKTQIVS